MVRIYRERKQEVIDPTTKYVVFSQRVSARSKASERRFSHSKASSDNAAAGRHALAYLIRFKELGVSDKRHFSVAALVNGTTITCELRLDLTLIRSPEYGILGRRVNEDTNHGVVALYQP